MKSPARLLSWLLAGCCGFAPVQAADPVAPGAALRALFDAEWERRLRDEPEAASYYGDTRYDERWTDLSLEAIAAREAAEREALGRLKAIPRARLATAEQIQYDSFLWLLQAQVDRQAFREYLLPVGHQSGPQTADRIAEVMPFNSAADYRRYLKRLSALPRQLAQVRVLMQEGLKAGHLPPRVLMERVPPQFAAQRVDDPAASPFYRPFKRMPTAMADAEQAALRAEALALIRDRLVPAYRELGDFFSAEYLPRARPSIAASDGRGGTAYYNFLARDYTTTPLSGEQIHAVGLREVDRLRAAMEKTKDEAGFKGDLAEFFTYLRSDPRFFYTTPAELLDAYRATAKRIDPELVKVFKTIPRLPYGVRPIPENIAPHTSTAYYQGGAADGTRPGYYYVNLYRPEVRPRWEMLPLSLHEAVPGHHFQISRAQELEAAPALLRNAYFVAYGEGWALYAEQLGYEMGLYDDAYDRFGQLTYEMWRAVRLVIDTGMHLKGWSREQAIDYFKANAPKTEQDIVNEVDRYIGRPGQALAYKIGQMKISELRERARVKLGAKFDLREFNDTVLATGSVPLVVLETHIDGWIAEQSAGR
ncbi:DUF885 family protein [uncultured Piscinibacter sp.]|uniref:DUF885 domain-containing protein n=1 Tax=uncultured Piscinibacter sp. TaxID=1131835 RepID=UPI00260C7860|nr:DUF885 domain-containing protein [uncultured Piscinibacter sp.]